MLDFDDGFMTADSLIEMQQNKWQFNSYVYSSQNHLKPKLKPNGTVVPPCDRLRVLIQLKDPIDNEYDRQAVSNALISHYNIDNKSVIDRSFMHKHRYFAHGTTDVSSFVDNRELFDWKKLPNLNQQKSVGRQSKANQLKLTFRLNDEIKDGKNVIRRISELKPNTPIFCSVCGDAPNRSNNGHNAVFMLNDENIPFIFCSSCESRGLGVGKKGVYNLHPDDIYKLNTEEKNARVFINTLNSKYYGHGKEPGIEGHVVRELSTLEQAKQFCKHHELNIPNAFPRARYELVFDSNKTVNFEEGYINRYQAPEILKKAIPVNHKAKYPRNIARIIDHVFAYDREIIDRFINDLAYVVQKRKKLITAYLASGTEGSGKGLMFTLIIQPIFGDQYCTQTDQDAFGSQFNSFLTENVFVLVNEVSGNFSSNERKNLNTIEKIKISITDEKIQIEGKNKDRINGKNVCSLLFATNRRHGLVLSKDDRRFNVAPRQEQKINETKWWKAMKGYFPLKEKVAVEIQEFVWYLKQIKIKDKWIGTVIQNEAKAQLQTMSSTNAETFFNAILSGDLCWIYDNIPTAQQNSFFVDNSAVVSLITGLYKRKGLKMFELCQLYNYINKKNLSTPSFSSLSTGYLSDTKNIREGKNVFKGIEVNWTNLPSKPDDLFSL